MKHVCEDCGAEFVASPKARYCPACRLKRRQANVKAVRRCVVCGKEFFGNARAKYCPDCRVQKRRENYHRHVQRKKEGQAIVRGKSIGTCEVCGKHFIIMAGGQRYCPDCAKAAYMASDRQKSKEWAERDKLRRQQEESGDG